MPKEMMGLGRRNIFWLLGANRLKAAWLMRKYAEIGVGFDLKKVEKYG